MASTNAVLQHSATPSARLWIATIVSASAMLFWGSGLHPVWWLTWFAPLPLLAISPRLSGRAAFVLAALSWLLGTLNMWHYFLRALEIPLLLVVILSIVPSCLFGIGILLFRKLITRGAVWKAALAFPTLWVSLEYLNNIASRHGTFPNLGYTQMDFLPILQISSVVGIWGITFCLFLFPATLAALLTRPRHAAFPTQLALSVAAFFVVVLGYGSWRLIRTPITEHSIRVGLTATGTATTFPHDDTSALQLLRDYSAKSEALARDGAQLIVLPEKIALISDHGTEQVDALYESLAVHAAAPILVGLDRGTIAKRWNEARLYFPDGRPPAVYDKHHLVPGFEDADQPGTTITVINGRFGPWGMQICKDMDFPGLSREYGRKRVGLLLVPAWDFTLDGWLHSRMAVMRGVENGFTVVRTAKQGLLTVSDDRGRILAQQDAAYVAVGTLLATATVQHDETLYSRWGDWFAWLNVAALGGIVVSHLIRR
jgi:apolipoprotein N-acyltransferase